MAFWRGLHFREAAKKRILRKTQDYERKETKEEISAHQGCF